MKVEIAKLETELDAAESSGCSLELVVERGQNLNCPDLIGKPHPFCRVWIESDQASSSSKKARAKAAMVRQASNMAHVVRKSKSDDDESAVEECQPVAGSNPDWNFKSTLKVHSSTSSHVYVKVLSKSKLKNKEIGTATLPLDDLTLNHEYRREVDLLKGSRDKPRGRIYLKLRLLNQQRENVLLKLAAARKKASTMEGHPSHVHEDSDGAEMPSATQFTDDDYSDDGDTVRIIIFMEFVCMRVCVCTHSWSCLGPNH